MGRGNQLCSAEHRRTCRGHHDPALDAEANLSIRLLPYGWSRLAARTLRPIAASPALDQSRRSRAAILLRIGLGRERRAAGPCMNEDFDAEVSADNVHQTRDGCA